MTDEGSNSRGKDAFEWAVSLLIFAGLVGVVLWSQLRISFVATDSMVPTYRPTDVVVIVGTHLVKPEIGDPVVFTAELYGTKIPPHIHRLVGKDDRGYITQGDHNAEPDPWRVSESAIMGTAVGHFPGWIIRSPLVLGSIIFVLVAAALWPGKYDDDPIGPPPRPEDRLDVYPDLPHADDNGARVLVPYGAAPPGYRHMPPPQSQPVRIPPRRFY